MTADSGLTSSEVAGFEVVTALFDFCYCLGQVVYTKRQLCIYLCIIQMYPTRHGRSQCELIQFFKLPRNYRAS